MKRVLLLLGLVVTAPLILIAKVALFVPRLLRRKLARPLTADEEGFATPFDQLPLRLKLEGPFFAVPGQAQFEQVGEGGAIAISMFPSLSLEEEASLGSASGRRWVAELLGESVLTQGTTVSLREEPSFVVVTREGLLDGARCIAGIVAHAAGLLAVQAAVHGEDAEQLTRSRRIIASVALTEAEAGWELARAETTTGLLEYLSAPEQLAEACCFELIDEAALGRHPSAQSVPFKAGLHWVGKLDVGHAERMVTAADLRAANLSLAQLLERHSQRVQRNAHDTLRPVAKLVFRLHSNVGSPLLIKSFHHDVREVIPGNHLVALVATRGVLVAPDSVEGLRALRHQVEAGTDPLLGRQQRPTSHIFRVRVDDEWEQVA